MSDFKIPAIDDTSQINGEVLRVCGVSTWEDEEDDGENVVVLMITFQKNQVMPIVEDVPEAFRDAFKE